MDRQQVYRVSYDLVVYGKREADREPVEEALLLARDFDAALALAKAIVPELRRTATHGAARRVLGPVENFPELWKTCGKLVENFSPTGQVNPPNQGGCKIAEMLKETHE
jgi:hypothetical protein